jgi:hypothetical protein
VKSPQKVRLNQFSIYYRGTGCVRFANGAVVELTVAEEELLELLLATPKITVPWTRLEYEMARSNQTIRHVVSRLRDKLGSRSIRTHFGRGASVQPHFIGTARFALSREDARSAAVQRGVTALPAPSTMSRLASVSR